VAGEDFWWGYESDVVKYRFGGNERDYQAAGFGRGSGGGGGATEHPLPRVLKDIAARGGRRYFFVPEARKLDWVGTQYPCGWRDWDALVDGIKCKYREVLGRCRSLDQVQASSISDTVFDYLKERLEAVYGRQRSDKELTALVPQTKKDLLKVRSLGNTSSNTD